VIDLPYVDDIQIRPQKASTSLMSPIELDYCQKEIIDLLDKGLIEPAKSPWAYRAFYVNKHSKIKRGQPHMVIKYKPLNAVLKNMAYPLPNQAALLQKLKGCNIFSKFDLKSGFYQIGIAAKDCYKMAFVVPHGQYQWKVMPFGLNNAPSEFQKRMEDVLNGIDCLIIYIDDLLVCSKNIQHQKHLQIFCEHCVKHGLALSKSKIEVGVTDVSFLGLKISNGSIALQDHVLLNLQNFLEQILDKTQLQRFLGSLNYIRRFYKGQAQDLVVLQQRLKKLPIPWNQAMTQAV